MNRLNDIRTHHGGCKKHSQLPSPPTNSASYQQELVYPPYNDQQYPKQEKIEQSPQYQQFSAPQSSANNQDAQLSPAYTPMTQNTTVGNEKIPSSITAGQGGPEKSPSYSQAYAEGFAAGKAAGSRPQSPERKWAQIL
jgi:hypothetical protein